MAYARYSPSCDWYIFWESSKTDSQAAAAGHPKPKEAEALAIWHADHRASAPSFTYTDVRAMIENDDFSPIPGYAESSRETLRSCLAEFIRDVHNEHEQVG